ncbi:MAG: general secretion pathway protein GspB [Pseudomonadota bacterium]
MSLILDALNKAEREKRSENRQVSDLLAPEAATSLESGQTVTLRTLLVSALMLFSVSLGGLALWFMLSADSADSGSGLSAQANRVSTQQNAAGNARRMIEDRAEASPMEQAGQSLAQPIPTAESVRAVETNSPNRPEQVADLYSQAALQRQRRAASGPLSQALAAGASAGANAGTGAGASVAGNTQRSTVVEKSTKSTANRASNPPNLKEESVEEAIDLAQALRQLQTSRRTEELLSHPAPMLLSLSKQFKDSVPTLLYQQHDFNPSGVSAVTLNGQSLRVRQRTRGVEVREILADSVILRFSGTDFRLRALNSWVNL